MIHPRCTTYILQEAPNHHIDLVEEYNNVIEVFANQYNLLTGTQLRFKSKIIQLTGLRDGVGKLIARIRASLMLF